MLLPLDQGVMWVISMSKDYGVKIRVIITNSVYYVLDIFPSALCLNYQFSQQSYEILF